MIKNKLVGGATMENRQRFFSKPTLSELACLVNIFSDIIYRLFSVSGMCPVVVGANISCRPTAGSCPLNCKNT